MCEGMELEDTPEWNTGFTEGWNACRKHSRRIMKEAMSELGVPQGNYPAPVANAYDILNDGRKRIELSR